MRYKLVEAESSPMLEHRVEAYLHAGWKLHGSPSLIMQGSNSLSSRVYIQAMTKGENECDL